MSSRETAADLECLKQELIVIQSGLSVMLQQSLKQNAQQEAIKYKEERGDVRRCSQNK